VLPARVFRLRPSRRSRENHQAGEESIGNFQFVSIFKRL